MDMEVSDNPFFQALGVSFALAIFMIGMAMGIMQMASTKASPIPIAVILLIFAVIFIIGSVFFERRGADQIGSLAGGGFISMIATFALLSFFGGISFAFTDAFLSLGWEKLVSALAVCMIASMLIVKFLSYQADSSYQ
nr:heat-shock protein [Methanohalophilus levihalophilus]